MASNSPRRRPRGAYALAAAILSSCTFVPPPPLPEEIAAAEAAENTRLAALRAGAAEMVEGGGVEIPAEFAAGDAAPIGMNAEQIRAYNRAQGDPEEGDFTLEEALVGVEGGGALWAEFVTSRGVIACQLFAEEAPMTVANFVGLARGLRPTKEPGGAWSKRRYYDKTIFHRVIPGFMVQAGDPTGTGTGSPGYVIADEINPKRAHEDAGALSMANRGPGTGGAQFFITLGPTPHLDGRHTIFGQCDDRSIDLADDLSMAPRDQNDRPEEDEVIETVRIVRRPAAK